MAGPIIEALRRMRANRMERRGFGDGMQMGFRGGMRGGLIRDMLGMRPPMPMQDTVGEVVQYAPTQQPQQAMSSGQAGPVFHSIGTGSGRQDRRGYTPVRPAARQMNPDPDGPDTALKRDYDGDGRPDAVQGGTEDLPSPGASAAAGNPQAAVSMLTDQYRAITAKLGDPRISEVEYRRLATQATAVMADLNKAREDHQQAIERESKSLAGQLKQLEPVRQEAERTGDWTGFGATVAGSYLLKDDKGVPLPGQDIEGIGSAAARPHVHNYARRLFTEYGSGEVAMPEEVRASLLRGLSYAHPMTDEDIKSPEAIRAWQNKVRDKLCGEFGVPRDSPMGKYFLGLTTMMRAMKLGQ